MSEQFCNLPNTDNNPTFTHIHTLHVRRYSKQRFELVLLALLVFICYTTVSVCFQENNQLQHNECLPGKSEKVHHYPRLHNTLLSQLNLRRTWHFMVIHRIVVEKFHWKSQLWVFLSDYLTWQDNNSKRLRLGRQLSLIRKHTHFQHDFVVDFNNIMSHTVTKHCSIVPGFITFFVSPRNRSVSDCSALQFGKWR